jgi:hypothetical protein
MKAIITFFLIGSFLHGAGQNVGIGTTSPAHKLHISNDNSTINALHISQAGDGSSAVTIISTGLNTDGVLVSNANNSNFGSNYVAGIRARVGTGGSPLGFPGTRGTFGIIAECLNETDGIGILGISHSSSPGIFEAAVVGYNFGTGGGSDAYGVVGITSGNSGAGVAGKSFMANAPGVLGIGVENNSTGIKAEIKAGFTGTSLEIKNGSVKVTGASKPVFQIAAVTGPGGNTIGNTLTIPKTTQANAYTDLLIVTPVYESVYLNKPIGVWWDGVNWNIFTQDQSAMPNGAIFNVLVVKQ